MATEPSTTALPESDSHFVPHIQGLRALAVLLVVVYHFWPNRLTGGYIGVDVFFVISGFLITGQLVRELRSSGRIALPAFWAKRIRRLIPASLLVLAVSVLLATFIMPLAYLPASLVDVSASSLYFQNWSLALGSVDYLSSASKTIAEHYWSLSLEEQFYVFWPLVLLGTFSFAVKAGIQRRWRVLVVVVLVLSILSLGFSIWYTAVNPAQAYFVIFTRIWEFGAGALLVLAAKRSHRAWLNNLLGFGGLLILFISAVQLQASSPFPGWLALFPVLGTVAILAMAQRKRWYSASGLLSLRPMRFIGDISYSLYLWHWPLIVVAPFIVGWGLSFVNRVILFLACFVLAWLTKKFVEDPARRWKFFTTRTPRYTFGWMLVALGAMGLLLLGSFSLQFPKYQAAATQLTQVAADPPACFGAAVITGCDNPQLADAIIPSPGFGNADLPGHKECFIQLNNSDVVTCEFGSKDSLAPRVALIGDSHAYQYIDAVIAQADKNGWALTTYLKGACPWTATEMESSNPAFAASCNQWKKGVAASLAEQSTPYDVIITTALSKSLVESAGSVHVAEQGLIEAWTSQAAGSRIVVISDNPVFEEDPNKCLTISTPTDCAISRNDSLITDDPLVTAASSYDKATLLDLRSLFCGEKQCWVVIGGADVYRDQDHLTATFANTVGPFIAESVKTALASK
mgnify:CR=1 FL=1